MKIGYPKEIKQKALELYSSGMNSTELSNMYGIHHSTILKWVQTAGIKVPKFVNITHIEGEEWYTIPEYEGYYELSNMGRVKSLPRITNYYTTRIVTHKYTVHRYPFVKLFKDGIGQEFFIHILLARMFIPNPLNLPEVNHKNLNKGDYSIDNLEWSTHADNMRHAHKNGAIKHGKLGENARAKKIGSFNQDREPVREYSCAKEAAQINGWHNQNLTFAARKGIMSHGLYWKYL